MRFFSWIILFISIASQAQNSAISTPSEYNNFIVQEQNKLVKMIIEFNLTNLYNTKQGEQNSQKEQILHQIETSINKINALGDFRGDGKLKNEALAVLKSYQSIFDIEFNEINTLRNQRETSYEAMEKYIRAIDVAEQKLKTGGDRFIKAQKEFAQKNKLTIQAPPRDCDLENFIKHSNYCRSIFLEYFRVSIKDNAFLDALNEQKTETMEMQRLQVLSATEQALGNISKIASAHEDTSFIGSAIQLIRFHKKLSENEYVELITIIKNQNRSQNDIDRFNSIVLMINERGQQLLNNFNNQNKELLRKYILGN